MAILSFTKDNRIDDFTFVLVRKDNVKIGTIKARNVDYKHNFNGPDELSLKVYKELDNERNPYWDRINDYNDLCVVQLGDDGYFEIEVTINEDSEGVYKSITATSRCEAELSHAKIYDCQINTEEDMLYDSIYTWDKDNVTLLYRDTTELEEIIKSLPDDDPTKADLIKQLEQMKYRSIMHRLLDKLPNYSIAHVDATLVELTDWYQFDWDDTDVYSILSGDLSEQYNVLFTFNSKDRTISLYDLFSVCQNNNCSYRQMMKDERNINTRYRADFHHVCPYCESTDITPGYGKFTKIIVSKDNLTTSAQVSSNKDSLINCFRVSGGDDLMDAAIINQNPNGSAYFYQFSEENMEEMPEELVNKIQEYNEEYDAWYKGDETNNKGIYTFTTNQVNNISNLVDYVIARFSPETSDQFVKLRAKYVGYQSLASMFYNIMDLQAFFEYSMAPDVVVNHDTLAETVALINNAFTGANATKIAVTDPSLNNLQGSVESAILQSIRCIINTALYEVSVDTDYHATYTKAASKTQNGYWNGKIKVVAIEYKNTDKEQENTALSNVLNITVNYNVADYSIQRVEALITRKDAKVTPITSISDANLKALKINGDISQIVWTDFDNVLQTYSLDTLTDIIRPCYVDSQDIIVSSGNAVNGLFYNYYTECLRRIDLEISGGEGRVGRQVQVNQIKEVMDVINNEKTGYRVLTHNALNFEHFLGEDLFKTFCNYRREDTYRNDNYISDDLDNNTIFQRAGDLIDYAQKELYKVSHLQFEVSGNLNNLLALPEFAPIKDDFEVGNWIKLAVDDKLYDLRLLSYSINFDDIQTINVDFSTVETIWMGNSDIQSVLKAAGSMAGSYNNVQLQVKNNQKTTKEVNKWVSEGMSATQTRFTNDPTTQEITYDSTGLLAKGYEDTTGEYYPQQLKINKNGIYLTDNNWQTIRTGVGAITFTNPSTGVTSDAYGIIGEAVVGKMLLGEQLVIANAGATNVVDGNGITIKNGNNIVFKADTSGNVSIVGDITAKTGKIGEWVIGDTGNQEFNGSLHYGNSIGTSGNIFLNPKGVTKSVSIAGRTGTDWVITAGNNFGVTSAGKLYANEATFTGTISSSTITGTTINNGSGTFKVESNGALTATSATITGSISSSSISSTNISGGSVTGATINNGSGTFKVESNGALTATSATITGSITATTLTATQNGTVGPWTISSTALSKSGGYNSATAGSAYLGNSGISILNTFVVDSNGYVTLQAASMDTGAGLSINQSSGSQHTQYGSDFIYIGDGSNARLLLKRDAIYYQTGTYSGAWTNNCTAIKFTPRVSGGTGHNTYPMAQTRCYNDDFLTPVGSTSVAGNRVARVGSGHTDRFGILGEWTNGGTWATMYAAVTSSDIRLKKNITDTTIVALPIINSIKMRAFDWKSTNQHQPIGMVADELEAIDPLLAFGGGYDKDGFMDVKSVNSFYLIGYLVKAIQELSAEQSRLKNKLKELKGE